MYDVPKNRCSSMGAIYIQKSTYEFENIFLCFEDGGGIFRTLNSIRFTTPMISFVRLVHHILFMETEFRARLFSFFLGKSQIQNN